MKLKATILIATLGLCLSAGNLYADAIDNMGPSSDAVGGTEGTGAINDNGSSNGAIQGTDAIRDQNTGIVPPSYPSQSDSGMSRDGETMGDDDFN